jgi:hypothetical protein
MNVRAPFVHPYGRRSLPVRRTGVAGFGAVASVVFHVLIVAPIVWSPSTQRKNLPNTQGAAASRDTIDGEHAMTVVFIDDATSIHYLSNNVDSTIAPLTPTFLLPISVASVSGSAGIDQLFDVSDRGTRRQEAHGDQSGHALMFGRYMGQISARIERGWRRPRSALDGASFVCSVQIVQGPSGNVQEITLQQCDGDLRWQASLVHAIENASPLPAPPDRALFSGALTLRFDSTPYVPGASDEGFEPVLRASIEPALPHGSVLKVSERQRRSGVSATIQPTSIDLTIIGSRTEIAPEAAGTSDPSVTPGASGESPVDTTVPNSGSDR